MHPYLLSYPAAGWRIRGGVNFRSREKAETSPRRAMTEWLALADAISDAGGEIAVVPPPEVDPPLTGMIYAANHGAWFRQSKTFLISKMFVEHRHDEAAHLETFLRSALGWKTEMAPHTWEGQADIATLPGNLYVLTWGVRTVREACTHVKERLGDAASIMCVKIRDPYFHGDTCMNMLHGGNDQQLLLLFPGALVDITPEQIEEFAGVEVLEISERDALAYACNALCIGKRVLVPRGVSTRLLTELGERGFEVVEMSFDELFGKGGGGPRCLVNELRGLEPSDIPDEVKYAAQRDALYELRDTYSE